ALTLEEKAKAWAKVESEYNSAAPHGPRTTYMLQNKWKLLKKQLKKDVATDRRETVRTGGGPPHKLEKPLPEEIFSRVMEITSSYSVMGSTTSPDSNAGKCTNQLGIKVS
ncbi:Hypothetical predicted protein, partial [Olea europaea subsp. europaea]